MIFVTIGTQLPFDRLIQAVDGWAGTHPAADCFAQIGQTSLKPQNMPFAPFLTAAETKERMETADLIVAHAGMGTVLSALQMGKPLLIVPRVCKFGEQRNDHQLATAAAFKSRDNVYVAMDETEVGPQLDALVDNTTFVGTPLGPHASPGLLTAVRDFIGNKS